MMRYTLSLTVALVLFWLMNSGMFTPIILALGVVSVAFVVLITRRMDVVDYESVPFYLSLRLPRYYGWLMKEIVLSNIKVVKHIVLGKAYISPSITTIKICAKTDMGKVILANSITLTPGTVAIELEDDEVTVHALLHEDLEALKDGEMDRRVCQLEKS
jgi:multicomponent Na+:H+ antiporter subunit E